MDPLNLLNEISLVLKKEKKQLFGLFLSIRNLNADSITYKKFIFVNFLKMGGMAPVNRLWRKRLSFGKEILIDIKSPPKERNDTKNDRSNTHKFWILSKF